MINKKRNPDKLNSPINKLDDDDILHKNEYPKTINDAITIILNILSPEEKEKLKNAQPEDLSSYHFGLGLWIRNNLGFYDGNEELIEDIKQGNNFVHPDDLSSILIEKTKEKLNK